MRAAFVADQQAVALRVIAAVLGLGMHRDKPAIGVLRLACADTFRHYPRFGVLAQMHHFRAGIGLLHVVGDRDGIKLALAVVTAQDAGRVFPRHGRAGLDLRPHHLGAITTAIGAFGHKVVDPALAVFITGIPVLHGGIFHLRIFLDDDFDHGGMQLRHIALRRCAAFKIGHIGPLVGNDQRAFKLPRVFGIDAEIGRQFHRAAHTRRDVHKRSVRKTAEFSVA